MILDIDTQGFLSDEIIMAALIGATATIIISIISSIISLFTNNKNRRLLKEVEFLKNELQKDTISYQIYLSELSKIKFKKLDELYQQLIEYIDFYKNKISTDYGFFSDPNELTKESYKLNSKTKIIYRKTRIYLNEEASNLIKKLLKNCEEITKNYSLRNIDKERFSETTNKISGNAEKIEPILDEIENELRKHLNIIKYKREVTKKQNQ
ncbi:MAG: hypothetical protein IMY72_00360 [Bacteroidetes bacterium]|nr:hypothetical protein [Bacteroidota bacterium]